MENSKFEHFCSYEGKPLCPKEVLYYFEEPVIFTAEFCGLIYLVSKVDEGPEGDAFLASPTSKKILEMLRAGRISMRSAVMQPYFLWIIASGGQIDSMSIKDASEIDDEFFPEPNCGLYLEHGTVFDRHIVENEESPLIGLYFSGGSLGREISLAQLKNVFDEAYNSFTKIFVQVFSIYVKREIITQKDVQKSFRIPVREPKFASLNLEICDPVFDLQAEGIDTADLREKIHREAGAFLGALKEAKELSSGESGGSVSSLNPNVQKFIEGLLPDDKSAYDTVELSTNLMEEKLKFSRVDGQILKDAIREEVRVVREISGVLDQPSSDTRSFYIRDLFGGRTRCEVREDLWDEIKMDIFDGAKNRSFVTVSGLLEERAKVNLCFVKDIRFPDDSDLGDWGG